MRLFTQLSSILVFFGAISLNRVFSIGVSSKLDFDSESDEKPAVQSSTVQQSSPYQSYQSQVHQQPTQYRSVVRTSDSNFDLDSLVKASVNCGSDELCDLTVKPLVKTTKKTDTDEIQTNVQVQVVTKLHNSNTSKNLNVGDVPIFQGSGSINQQFGSSTYQSTTNVPIHVPNVPIVQQKTNYNNYATGYIALDPLSGFKPIYKPVVADVPPNSVWLTQNSNDRRGFYSTGVNNNRRNYDDNILIIESNNYNRNRLAPGTVNSWFYPIGAPPTVNGGRINRYPSVISPGERSYPGNSFSKVNYPEHQVPRVTCPCDENAALHGSRRNDNPFRVPLKDQNEKKVEKIDDKVEKLDT